ncbi:MAG: methylenetetrahydrofolate reductase [Tidjanibacter sp.]|nr:methylenetetrahydrofolate reductase [Tidjanibacter sp.]MBR6831477.1 methylenetetrahydrofolate reductase [Tidjanibacter sp.]
MKVTDIINNQPEKAKYTFEIIPPLKGVELKHVLSTQEPLFDLNPAYINITSHRDILEKRTQADGSLKPMTTTKRVGTIALAAAIMKHYNIEVVPHVICAGRSRNAIENDLIDLSFLEMDNIMALRGDAIKGEPYTPHPEGYRYASELVHQIVNMNNGIYLDESINGTHSDFCIGVGCYPEKHFEASSLDEDVANLKKKADAGADYAVTQMFFDNNIYYEFVDKCRKAGITIPIIPGLKPVSLLNQVDVLPKSFHLAIPEELDKELRRCKNNDDAKVVGTEWCIMQTRDLLNHGINHIHYYTLMARDCMINLIKTVF